MTDSGHDLDFSHPEGEARHGRDRRLAGRSAEIGKLDWGSE
jgi:hypothetical protein